MQSHHFVAKMHQNAPNHEVHFKNFYGGNTADPTLRLCAPRPPESGGRDGGKKGWKGAGEGREEGERKKGRRRRGEGAEGIISVAAPNAHAHGCRHLRLLIGMEQSSV